MCDQCEIMRVKLLNKENQIEELNALCKEKDEVYEKHNKEKNEIYRKHYMEKDEIYRKHYREIDETHKKLIVKHENEIDQFLAKRMNTLFDVAYGRIKDLEAELKHLKT